MSNCLCEELAILGTLDPVSQGAATVVSDWCPMAEFDRILAILSVGVLGTSATVDAKLRQATDASGTGAKDITGKAITQLTQAGTDANKQVLIEARACELDLDNSFNHVALSVTVATAACLINATLMGGKCRYDDASQFDLASVDEIVK